MKIVDILAKKMTLSFEVFPPKDDVPMDGILDTLSRLYRFKPDFISCTYGAGGTKRGRNMEVCEAVQKSGNLIMPHFTCIGNSRDDIRKFAGDYFKMGIKNMLAIRGDFPPGWQGTKGDFSNAGELIDFLHHEFPLLCIAAAACPEKHINSSSIEADIAHLRLKQDRGAEFLITQLCHDAAAFERFLEKIRKAGIGIPVIAGIMPILTCDPVIRMAVSNGCSIPAELASIIGKYSDDPESFARAGIDYTAAQIHRFIALGINGLHLYSMNKWKQLTEILEIAGVKG